MFPYTFKKVTAYINIYSLEYKLKVCACWGLLGVAEVTGVGVELIWGCFLLMYVHTLYNVNSRLYKSIPMETRSDSKCKVVQI